MDLWKFKKQQTPCNMNRKRYSSPSRFIVSFFRLKKIVLVIYLKKHTVKNVFSLKKKFILEMAMHNVLFPLCCMTFLWAMKLLLYIVQYLCMYMLLQSRSKLHDGIEYEKKFKNSIVFFLCFFVYFVMVLFSFFLVVFCLLDTLTQLLFCSISSFQAHCVVLF